LVPPSLGSTEAYVHVYCLHAQSKGEMEAKLQRSHIGCNRSALFHLAFGGLHVELQLPLLSLVGAALLAAAARLACLALSLLLLRACDGRLGARLSRLRLHTKLPAFHFEYAVAVPRCLSPLRLSSDAKSHKTQVR